MNSRAGFIYGFRQAEAAIRHDHHRRFLELCKERNIVPRGLKIKKDACIGTKSKAFMLEWETIKCNAELGLQDSLIKEQLRMAKDSEVEFWGHVQEFIRSIRGDVGQFMEWYDRITSTLEFKTKELNKRRLHKFRNLVPNDNSYASVTYRPRLLDDLKYVRDGVESVETAETNKADEATDTNEVPPLHETDETAEACETVETVPDEAYETDEFGNPDETDEAIETGPEETDEATETDETDEAGGAEVEALESFVSNETFITDNRISRKRSSHNQGKFNFHCENEEGVELEVVECLGDLMDSLAGGEGLSQFVNREHSLSGAAGMEGTHGSLIGDLCSINDISIPIDEDCGIFLSPGVGNARDWDTSFGYLAKKPQQCPRTVHVKSPKPPISADI